MSEPLTLYGETLWISPYVYSSYVALREKGLDFELTEVSLLDMAHQRPEYRDSSLTAKVPALRHGNFWLAESSAIVEYLDDAFSASACPRLLPSDFRQRARARQLMAWMRSDLAVLRDDRPTTSIFIEAVDSPLSVAGRADAEKLLRVAQQVIPSAGENLFGAWSIVDAELALMLHRLIANRDEVPGRIKAYAEKQWQRPSAQEFIRHQRPKKVPEAYWQHDFTRVAPPK